MKNEWNWKALSTATGIFWGGYVGLSTLFETTGVQIALFNSGTFSMLATIYPSLTPTLPGAFLGLIIGAVCGAICGGIFAWLYNWASEMWK